MKDDVTDLSSDKMTVECKSYKRRWLILAIFVLFSASNAAQWLEYSIIANIVQKYYNVGSTAVDWTSMIYMIIYIPMIFPGSYFLDKKGLRNAAILGSLLNCAGAWLKVLSIHPDRFWLTFLGQSLTALGQVFILSLPARVAAVWFGTHQVSLACSIGVFGNQLGVALGFLLPPVLVKKSDYNIEKIGDGLAVMYYMFAGITTAVFLAVLIFFKSKPPLPPSIAQANTNTTNIDGNIDNASEKVNFFTSLKALMLNYSYVLLILSYGINCGIYYAISTLLNQIILQYHEDAEEDAGRIGLVMIIAGMLGSVCCGFVLDKTHKYKETTLAVYIFSLFGMIIYTFTVNSEILVIYFISALLGFFMTGYLPVGFELAAELTYPQPEGTAAGLLNASAQVFGIAFTSLYAYILNTVDDRWANIVMSAMLFLGTVLTALIKSDLRRQNAQKG